MKKIVIELLKLEVIKVNAKEREVDIKIDYNSNSEFKEALIRMKIDDVETAALKVLKYVKRRERGVVGGYDVMESILIVNVANEERMEEKLSHFFGKILDRIGEFNSKKSSEGYLNMYSGLSGQKIEFSKSI